ncbi:hypothetical protein DRW03_32675 [Corallococcus sp. H22C18031201]|uniref:immunity 49 family protein n=1 Tax=Citreicoccus inhibens TaxID=2849499 RepID=UPI000E76235F|nr:immunity 49 family protein [Citreicoccus inhibens]MBU8897963.1 immunity 49 family protein [Citreicoccus inhibens]RJS15834.1 hypothetical protein DRW03_32675 [Corallococcus sp. H22C18031201]
MRLDPLELAQENYGYQLQRALQLVEEGDGIDQDFATITFSYRILGICALLQDLNGEQFATLLCKSGLARLNLLRRAAAEVPAPGPLLAISKDTGFVAALAAGDLDTAHLIASHSPKTFAQGVEYEEDFLFFHFQQRLLSTPGDKTALQDILDRWTRLVKGEPTAYLAVCEALLDMNEDAFCAGLDAVLETRKANIQQYRKQLDFDQEIDATEGKVYLNGLALVRLAQSRKLAAPERLDLIPRLAREASCRPMQEDAWLRP